MEPPATASPSGVPSDPPQDDSVPTFASNIAFVLPAARILLGHGRHLVDTIRQRATAPNFHVIAECFGTSNVSTILAHLNRGILRSLALERVLLARAATGRDIDFVERRPHTPPEPQPAPTDAEAL